MQKTILLCGLILFCGCNIIDSRPRAYLLNSCVPYKVCAGIKRDVFEAELCLRFPGTIIVPNMFRLYTGYELGGRDDIAVRLLVKYSDSENEATGPVVAQRFGSLEKAQKYILKSINRPLLVDQDGGCSPEDRIKVFRIGDWLPGDPAFFGLDGTIRAWGRTTYGRQVPPHIGDHEYGGTAGSIIWTMDAHDPEAQECRIERLFKVVRGARSVRINDDGKFVLNPDSDKP